jgi:hypothetical protein
MIATVKMSAQRCEPMVDYLRQVEVQLEKNRIDAAARREIISELKSHLIDRIADFQAAGSPDPLGQALVALGNPTEIATEFAATATLRRASRSFFPTVLLLAAWSLGRTFGHSLRLFAIGLVGYAVSIGGLVAMVAKLIVPEKVGFWIGDHGLVWGIPPEGAVARELAGNWFIPLSAWLAIVAAVGTTLLLRKHIHGFLASRRMRQRHA